MDKPKKNNINFTRNVNTLLFIISIFLSIPITWYFSSTQLPYQVDLIEKRDLMDGQDFLYHDVNFDGPSEEFHIRNKTNPESHNIVYAEFDALNNRKVLTQYNLDEFIHSKWIFFHDISSDGWDEVIVYTQNSDSLLISVIDLDKNTWIVKQQCLLKGPLNNGHHTWDITNLLCEFSDLNNDGYAEIILAIRSGESIRPRGIYIFDARQKKIINERPLDIAISGLTIADLNMAGRTDILLTSNATGNIASGYTYGDQNCWLFALDSDLNFLFDPIAIGEYPSSLSLNVIDANTQPQILVTYRYNGYKNIPDKILVIDPNGTLITERNFLRAKLVPPVDISSTNETELISAEINKGIWKINDKLDANFYPLPVTIFQSFGDLNNDFEPELIIGTGRRLQIYNKDIKPLARLQYVTLLDNLQVRTTGDLKSQLVAKSENVLFYLKLSDPLYNLSLPAYLLISIPAIFSLLVFIHFIIKRVHVFSLFLFHLLRRSSNGLMLIDQSGKTIRINSKIMEFFRLDSQFRKGVQYKELLMSVPEIIRIIDNELSNYVSGSKTSSSQHEITFHKNDFQFRGELHITPLNSKFGIIYAFLIEVINHTESVISDRTRTWSRSVQKMAHDIKQPLSTIALNLKILQRYLSNENISEKERITENLEIMRSELDRVRDMTKSFLKFVNLENPSLQVIDLQEIVQKSLERYKIYDSCELRIETDFDEEIKYVKADPKQLEMLIHILIENAIDALKGKGLIRVTTVLAHNPDVFHNSYVEVEISDNGPGIPEDIINQVFEPFYTSKREGTGIGLAIAKKIVEDHHGKIDVYSTPELGATFSLTIPVFENHEQNT